jgi:HEAT repeat protein
LQPDEANRGKVSRALNTPLLDEKSSIREDTLKALKIWATKANTANLLKLLGDYQKGGPAQYVRVVEVLGSLKDASAATAIAQGLIYQRERDTVARALLTIGPEAEGAVIPFLQSQDRGARLTACRILAEIGSAKSVPALRDALNTFATTDTQFVNDAQMAIQMIQSRK